MIPRRFAGALLALMLMVPAARSAEWFQYSEPDFELYGDANRKQITDVLRSMQVYRYARDTVLPNLKGSDVVRPRIFVLSGSSFQKYAYVRRNVAGFVTGHDFGIDIVIDGSVADWTGTSSIIQHELTHYYLKHSADSVLPVWYDEGLAEYLSTLDIERGNLRIGFPAQGRWSNLQALPWMPLREMFNATRSSAAYTSHGSGAAFYAQSWVLVHYMILAGGDDTRKIGLMVAYIDRGLSADEAIQRTFGVEFPAFEARVKKYAHSSKMSYMKREAPSVPDVRDRITKLDEKTALTELVLFGLRTHKHDDDDVRKLAATLAEDPANGRAAAASAFIGRAAGDWSQGVAALERCSSLESDDIGLVLCGDAWMAPAWTGRADPTGADKRTSEAARQAAKLYSRAWAANPRNFEAINSMAMAYYQHREGGPQIESELRSAISRYPKSANLRIHLARLQAGNGNLLESKRTLEAVLMDSNDPNRRLQIIRMLREVDNQIAAQEGKSDVPAAAARSPASSPTSTSCVSTCSRRGGTSRSG